MMMVKVIINTMTRFIYAERFNRKVF